MVTFQINFEGVGQLNTYLNGIKRKLKVEKNALPTKLGFSVRRGIREALTNKKYDGNYRKFTGTGLHESIRVKTIAPGFVIVEPDPAQSGIAYPGGTSTILAPQDYANIIEKNQRYFANGFRIGLKNLNAELEKAANKIIR